MKLTRYFLQTFCAMLAGVAILLTSIAPNAYASKEVADGLSLFGDMRYRLEQDTDDNKTKDRTRDRIRLRVGAGYKANDNVSMGFRLSTGASSIQSPHTTLEVANAGKNGADFGLDRGYIAISGGPAVLLLGKWGSPLFNPAEFVHDEDISFEGIGAAATFGDDIKITGILARHFVTENNWNGWDDDTLLTYQLIIAGGGDVSWKAAVGGNTYDQQSANQTHSIYHGLLEVRAKEMSDLRLGGGYASYSGDYSGKSEDETGFVVYARAKVGPVGLRLYYWDVGYASQLLFGAAGQDNFPYSTNFTGWHAQVDLPKLFDAVSWDLRYYTQDTKNESLVSDSSAVQTGKSHNRTRTQININVKF